MDNTILVAGNGNKDFNEISEISAVSAVKCKPGQGKLNRMIVKAQALLAKMGHPARRFKRDYAAGIATYTCPHCGAIAVVTVNRQMDGTALFTECTHSHGETTAGE